MTIPIEEIEGCRLSHLRLASAVAGVSEPIARQSSNLPGWSVAHVLAHLALNADAMRRRIEAAIEGEQIEQYPGGKAGRAAMIETASEQAVDVLIAEVTETATALDACFAGLSSEQCELPVRTVGGTSHPIAALPFRRWREVEVHIVDLGLGATPADWPDGLVDRATPRILASLERRADSRELMAWVLGRGDAPTLDAWA